MTLSPQSPTDLLAGVPLTAASRAERFSYNIGLPSTPRLRDAASGTRKADWKPRNFGVRVQHKSTTGGQVAERKAQGYAHGDRLRDLHRRTRDGDIRRRR